MLEAFYIIHRGGLLLWSRIFSPIAENPINDFISETLLRDHSVSAIKGPFKIDSMACNDYDIIIIAIHREILQLSYVNELLQRVKELFSRTHCKTLFDAKGHLNLAESSAEFPLDFGKYFDAVLEYVERDKVVKSPQPRTFKEKYSNNEEGKKKSSSKKKSERKWDDKVSSKDAKELDYSSGDAKGMSSLPSLDRLVDAKLMLRSPDGIVELSETEDTTSNESEKSFLSSIFQTLTGQKKLTMDDLLPIETKMKEHLIQKNVASNIAQTICESVSQSLVGTTTGTFSSVSNVVKQATEDVIRKILTPKTSIDLLRDIKTKKPYVVVFVGVNGVGKSTNLSKTCFWLLRNKFKILVAACDTFRSGAVEQLRVHVSNLMQLDETAQVELYEKGYGKDAAAIANEAINYGKKNNFDVVLIDTAGRMQDNEPLMRSLAKLVNLNLPDKIIFVGEALVGNEAVDQLSKFNQALKDFSQLEQPRQIDGILLTKFDTIDDKVGAALSMTYTSGAPILFVGTGQTYTDLRKMNLKTIVDSLLK